MADDILTDDYGTTAKSASGSYGPVGMRGKRKIVASLEVTAVSGSGTPTMTALVEHTNVDASLQSTADYWKLLFAFTAVSSATTLPFYEIKTVVDDGAKKDVGRYIRVRYVLGGNSPGITGRTRIGYDKAITE